jgi:aminopeptidase N
MKNLALVLTLLAGATPAAAERLPVLAAPEHYKLDFTPDLRRERFEARKTIGLRILVPTRKLVLHAVGLDFTEARVVTGAIEQRAVVSIDPKTEQVTLHVPVDLKPGIAELHLAFSGRLNRELRGFYISESNGRKYAATQLEATDARRMFASYDEPDYKATFDISVVVASGDDVISNGAVEFIRPGPREGMKTIDFTTTAPMSSYLVALAVGDFECVEERVGGTPVRVCATPDKTVDTIRNGGGARIVRVLQPLFRDRLPVPEARSRRDSGFRRRRDGEHGRGVLSGEAAPRRARCIAVRSKRAALVIAHEPAHQWFGNLVTMKWWDDLWLNEGVRDMDGGKGNRRVETGLGRRAR